MDTSHHTVSAIEFYTPGLPGPITVRVRAHSTSVSLGIVPSYAFDRAGRFIEAYIQGGNYLRGLDGRIMHKYGRSPLGFRLRRDLTTSEVETFLADMHRLMVRIHTALNQGAIDWVSPEPPDPMTFETIRMALCDIVSWTPQRLAEDTRRFAQIYRPIGILPPDQYRALVLQATEGCSYNRCTFCTFYRDHAFHVKSQAEFETHLAAVKNFFGPALSLRRSIFLAGANALAISMRRLVPMFDAVNTAFPVVPSNLLDAERVAWRQQHAYALDGIYAFIDAFNTRQKTSQDFARLRARNLRRVYIGLESGHDPLLAWLDKPGTAQDAIDAVRTIKDGGVSVGIIIMLGVGGSQFARGHICDTIATINAMPLSSGDLVYFSEFVEPPDSEYHRRAEREGLVPLNATELQAQMVAIRTGFRFPDPAHPPKVSIYDIREFIY